PGWKGRGVERNDQHVLPLHLSNASPKGVDLGFVRRRCAPKALVKDDDDPRILLERFLNGGVRGRRARSVRGARNDEHRFRQALLQSTFQLGRREGVEVGGRNRNVVLDGARHSDRDRGYEKRVDRPSGARWLTKLRPVI